MRRDLQLTGFVVSVHSLSFARSGGGRRERTHFIFSSTVVDDTDVRDLRVSKIVLDILPVTFLGLSSLYHTLMPFSSKACIVVGADGDRPFPRIRALDFTPNSQDVSLGS